MNLVQRNIRVSLSLACITLFVFFVAGWLDILPNENKEKLQARIDFVETLAVQLSVLIEHNKPELIPITLDKVAKRNPAVISIVLTQQNGDVIASHGVHQQHEDNVTSTTNHLKVPIFRDGAEWNIVEVYYEPLQETYLWGMIGTRLLHLAAFIAIFGFIVYYIIVSKIVKHLDPYQAIPGRVKLALDSLAEGVVLIDEDEQIILSNKSFENNSNLNSGQLFGNKLSLLSWNKPQDNVGNKSMYPWQKTLKDGNSRTNVKLDYASSENYSTTFIVNSMPLKNDKNTIRGALVSFSDVTDLEKMNHELESMTDFIRHEMRNALIGATGSVALLEKRESLSEAGKELVGRTQQLHRVIQFLLESVREARNIEATFKQEAFRRLRLDSLIENSVKNYSEMYQDNEFIYKSDGHALTVNGQEERLIQMLDKLATNAIDHGSVGTPIYFSCSYEEGYAVIRVINAGNALPENKQAIFDLFASFRNETTKIQNHGIGLYVVKLIAERYGGSVEARDREEVRGAEFVIRLPVVS